MKRLTNFFGGKKEALADHLSQRPEKEFLIRKGILKEEAVPLRSTAVEKLCHYLEQHALELEGIFRVSGNALDIHSLYLSLAQESFSLHNQKNPHNVSGTLKRYFRDQSEPVIPFHLFDKFQQATTIEDQEKKLEALKNAIILIPTERFQCLSRLFQLLHKISLNSKINLMSSNNLGVVMGQAILWPKDSTIQFQYLQANNNLATFLIDFYPNLFETNKVETPATVTVKKDTNKLKEASFPNTIRLSKEPPKIEPTESPVGLLRTRSRSFSSLPSQALRESTGPTARPSRPPPSYPPPPLPPTAKRGSLIQKKQENFQQVVDSVIESKIGFEERIERITKFRRLLYGDDHMKEFLREKGVDQLIDYILEFCDQIIEDQQ
eukprot:TRINITY_DN8304_c0_g1_i1.p1 TRINITY_DN8304_c0_g1~~TRINITY_DN8304_c0_g1_i1.p1  ORF type:complete len:379 (-),score=69.82 TRINITY_DN8304_c0_g1_i1:58-1194(-)